MSLAKFFSRGAKFFSNDLRRRSFEKKIHPDTWSRHDQILEDAKFRSLMDGDSSNFYSDIARRGQALRNEVLTRFKNKYCNTRGVRILIHIPPKAVSPGGHSLFSNLLESIRYIGIPCEGLYWGESTEDRLESFRPTVLMSSDNDIYRNRINWAAVERYRHKVPLQVGLTASIEAYGNSPLQARLDWAKSKSINFFYSFRSPEYLEARKDYALYFLRGYSIYSIEFGANPLHYYPIDAVKDLPYTFLASSNPDKQRRYEEWLTPIISKYPGFLDGPGWSNISQYAEVKYHKFLYARARVGINLHIDDSIDWASELNERTYILAACGIPQLIDNPLLLKNRFTKQAMFQANSPSEYKELFEFILNSPNEDFKEAYFALQEVYAKHTTFHRAESFINQMAILSNEGIKL